MKVITGSTLNSAELGKQYQKDMEERHKNPDLWRGLTFGHPDLDRITGGVRKTEFIVVAGAQKAGKTTIGLAWTINWARQIATTQPDSLILYISLEMSHENIAGRVLANLADIDVTKFRDYALQDGDWPKLDRGVAELEGLPVLWNVGCYTMDGIEELVKQHAGKIRLIVVDYFQLMAGDAHEAKRYEQLETLSRRLKQLATGNNLSVVAISQQNREALVSPERQKDPNTMAGTQALARDCDLLLIILPYVQDKQEVPHMRKIHIALARNAKMADITLDAIFSAEYCRFGAPATEEFAPFPQQATQESYWEVEWMRPTNES